MRLGTRDYDLTKHERLILHALATCLLRDGAEPFVLISEVQDISELEDEEFGEAMLNLGRIHLIEFRMDSDGKMRLISEAAKYLLPEDVVEAHNTEVFHGPRTES